MKKHLFQKALFLVFAFLFGVFLVFSQASVVTAKQAEPVDPETVRGYSYTGSYRVGNWLSTFDENNQCIGTTYAIFNAAAPFNQFGFPAVWAGASDNGTDASFTASVYVFNETPERSFEAEPVFSETIHQNGDNSYGAIFPMEKTLPAGKYIILCSQVTGNESGTKPYIVLPTGTASMNEAYIEFGGTADGVLCFFVDFIKDPAIEDYFLPLGTKQIEVITRDEAVIVLDTGGSDAHRLGDGDTLAILTAAIPEDKYLTDLTFLSMPTWSNNGPDSNLSYEVYVWNTNYSKTVSEEPMTSGEIKDHHDNQALNINFKNTLKGGVRYLIVTRSSGTMAIGFWQSPGTFQQSNWKVYLNEKTAPKDQMPGFSYTLGTVTLVDPPQPTETPAPIETPSPESTPAPDLTPKETADNNGSGCSTSITPTAGIALLAVLFFSQRTHKKQRH